MLVQPPARRADHLLHERVDSLAHRRRQLLDLAARGVGRSLLVDEEDGDAVDDRVLVPLLARAVAQRAPVARADELECHYDLTDRMFTLSASVVGA